MANDEINITFSDGPAPDANQASASSVLGEGVTDAKETDEQLFERLFGDLTDTMAEIFNLLSGESSNNGLFDKIKETATSILGGTSADSESAGEGAATKDTSFTKATKVAGLKPEDINIVDQQYILGALLVNSTLVRIENLLKSSSKGKKTPAAAPEKEEGGSGKGGKKNIKSLKSDMKDFNEVNNLASVIIPILMKNMAAVKWGLVNKFFKNLKKTVSDIVEITNEMDDNSSSIENFLELSGELIGGTLIIAAGLSLLGVLTPLILIGAVGALALQVAIKPLLKVVDSIGTNKNTKKFIKNARDIQNGTLAMLASTILLTFMLPFLIPAMLATGLLIVEVLLIKVLLNVMPKPGLVLKGTVGAILLAIFFSSMALAVFMAHTVGTDIKTTLLNLAVIGIVAVAGAVIAAILGIPFVLGLVALGTVTAISLAVFFTAIFLSMKVLAKSNQYSRAAIEALGHISKRSKNGDDGTEKKDSAGILGFFSTLASWNFIKALLVSIVTTSLLAIVGLFLFIGAKMIESGFKVLAKMSEDYFPIGKSLKDTTPGAAIIAINHFTKFISGKEDEFGNPIDKGEALVGWSTLLLLLPLVAYGILLKFAAKSLVDGFKEFGESITPEQIKKAEANAKSLKSCLNVINNQLITTDDSKLGPLGTLLKWLGFGELVDAAHILMACLPILALGFYGKAMQTAATPLAEGIKAIGDIDASKITTEKMNSIKMVMNQMMTILNDQVDTGFFKVLGDKFSDKFNKLTMVAECIGTMAAAFPNLVTAISMLSGLKPTEFNTGVNHFLTALNAITGSGSYAYTGGGIIAAVSAVGSSSIKTSTVELFASIVETVVSLQPFMQAVLDFASLDEEAFNRGLNGVLKIFESAQSLLDVMNVGASGEENAVNKVLSIMENNSAAKANSSNALKEIIELFSTTKNVNFTEFSNNTTLFAAGMNQISSGADGISKIKVEGFKDFVNALASANIATSVSAIGELVAYKDDINAMSESFDKMGNALAKIAAIDTSKLTAVVQAANASATAVANAQREANANAQGTTVVAAVDEYSRYIAQMLCTWEMNGIKLRTDDVKVATIVEPKVNNATTSFNWGN